MPDDRTPGEIARSLDALAAQLTTLGTKIDGLSGTFTPREVHDLALGGVKIDIRRIDEAQNKAEGVLDALQAELNRRFRQAVTLAVTAFLAPLTVALVVYVMTQVQP